MIIEFYRITKWKYMHLWTGSIFKLLQHKERMWKSNCDAESFQLYRLKHLKVSKYHRTSQKFACCCCYEKFRQNRHKHGMKRAKLQNENKLNRYELIPWESASAWTYRLYFLQDSHGKEIWAMAFWCLSVEKNLGMCCEKTSDWESVRGYWARSQKTHNRKDGT